MDKFADTRIEKQQKMRNILFYSLALFTAFSIYAQSDSHKEAFLTLNRVHLFSEDRSLRLPKMGWYSNYPEVEIDYHTLPNNKASLFIPTMWGRPVNAYFHLANRDIVGKKIVSKS